MERKEWPRGSNAAQMSGKMKAGICTVELVMRREQEEPACSGFKSEWEMRKLSQRMKEKFLRKLDEKERKKN